MQKKMSLKSRQRNPDSPPELIRHYQIVVNVLDHYSGCSRFWGNIQVPEPDYFKNVRKAPRFSIVDSWKNVKKLLKRKN